MEKKWASLFNIPNPIIMKRLILLLLVCLIGFSFANSQIKYGVKGGLSIANQKWSSGSISITPDSRTGGAFGVFLRVHTSERFAIQPEILYVMKGTKLDGELFEGDAADKVTFENNYLSIPVIAKVYFNGFNIQAGPSFDFLLSSKISANGMSEDVKESFKVFDLGLSVGLGYDFKGGLTFDGRYVLGLTDMNDEPEMEGVKMTNNCFLITMGIAF